MGGSTKYMGWEDGSETQNDIRDQEQKKQDQCSVITRIKLFYFVFFC